MWDTEGLHAMNNDEKIDEDKEDSRNEEIGDEDQGGGASKSVCTCLL